MRGLYLKLMHLFVLLWDSVPEWDAQQRDSSGASNSEDKFAFYVAEISLIFSAFGKVLTCYRLFVYLVF